MRSAPRSSLPVQLELFRGKSDARAFKTTFCFKIAERNFEAETE